MVLEYDVVLTWQRQSLFVPHRAGVFECEHHACCLAHRRTIPVARISYSSASHRIPFVIIASLRNSASLDLTGDSGLGTFEQKKTVGRKEQALDNILR